MNARQTLLAIGFAILIGIGAQIAIDVPGSELSITLQTVFVLVAGAVLGTIGGGFAILFYLLLGTLGFGVFADGASGGGVLFGPSGGYLLGFWLAAVSVGYASDRDWLWRPSWLLPFWMVGAHVLILLVGAGLLSVSLGVTAAWFNGVVPFLTGGVLKSVAAAILAMLLVRPARQFMLVSGSLGEGSNGQESKQNG